MRVSCVNGFRCYAGDSPQTARQCIDAICRGIQNDTDDIHMFFTVRLYGDRTPLGRMGRMGVDIKGAALFLATAASDYVTGINLPVDGGVSSWQ